MARRIAITQLNADSIDIVNSIRAYSSREYQDLIPQVTDPTQMPAVGETLYGYPALANQFISALVNRIAIVRVKSATFNNAYAELKKGYLEFGETVHEVFVNICKAREFNPEKGAQRELKRSLPDVRSAFHVMNWRVQYPVTIQHEDLRQAFNNPEGVADLIAKIIGSVTTGAEYDEYLLFKYLLIKAIAHGKVKAIGFDATDPKNSAVAFRGTSNKLTFMSNQYNEAGVTTTTPKESQYIFMDAQFNAEYDVNVLASAFNMDNATFMGKLKLVDDWATFDNSRFDEICKESGMIEEVTSDELELMKSVKAVLLDEEWFQVYDELTTFTENFIASGISYNYYLNIWKIVSSSPFSNAVVFTSNEAHNEPAGNLKLRVVDVQDAGNATIITLNHENGAFNGQAATFVNSAYNVSQGVAVHPYGVYIVPKGVSTITINAVANGLEYGCTGKLNVGEVAKGASYTAMKGVTIGDTPATVEYMDEGSAIPAYDPESGSSAE